MYELVIIGAGPAGLAAGIYGARAGLKTVILERALVGGLTAIIDLIENYPGFPEGIKGIDLTERMKQQAQRFGVEFKTAEALAINKKGKSIVIKTNDQDIDCHAVIIATGTLPKKLNIPGEDALRGRGVSYCATCDGPLFKGKTLAVIGCGNSGLQEGRFLLNFAEKITFIEFLPQMTADQIIQDRLKNEPRAEFLLQQEAKSINGKERVESITVQDRINKEEKIIPVHGVFIYAGMIPKTGFVKNTVEIDTDGYILVNNDSRTTVPGIFAAGDVCAGQVRQIIAACGHGAAAAVHAYHYIEDLQ